MKCKKLPINVRTYKITIAMKNAFYRLSWTDWSADYGIDREDDAKQMKQQAKNKADQSPIYHICL